MKAQNYQGSQCDSVCFDCSNVQDLLGITPPDRNDAPILEHAVADSSGELCASLVKLGELEHAGCDWL